MRNLLVVFFLVVVVALGLASRQASLITVPDTNGTAGDFRRYWRSIEGCDLVAEKKLKYFAPCEILG